MAADRRQEKRHQKIVLVRYYNTAEVGGKSVGFFKFAITANLSENGLAFRSLQPFEQGITLTLMSDDLWDTSREGRVRWCSEAVPGVYIVGVALS